MSNGQMPIINVGGNLPPEILQQQQALNRQQQMAQLLMQQGQSMPSGQMVSGRYVAPSFFQYAAPLFQTYAGKSLAEKAEKEQLALAEKLRGEQTRLGKEYLGAMQGKEAVYEPNIPTETYETVQGKMISPATGPNYQRAFEIANDPLAPAWAKAQAMELMKPRVFKEGETFSVPSFTGGEVKFNQMGGGGMVLPSDLKSVAIRLGLPTDSSKWTDQQRQLADATIKEEKRLTGTNLTVNTGQKGFDNTLKLRGDFRSEPVYKGFQEIESAFGQINKGLDAKSPAGDLAAATKFMKLLDPTSVVRESELAMAMQASGALDRLYNLANNIYTGQKLTPTQREDFRTLAKDFYSTSYDQYSTKREEYVGIAKRNELNIEDVVGKEPKAPTVAQPPVYAVNKTTGERIQSTDGGKTWKPAPKAK